MAVKRRKGFTILVLDGPNGLRQEKIEEGSGARWRQGFKLAVLLAALTAGALFIHRPGEQAVAAPTANPTDQILVKFKSSASQAAIDALNASNAVQQVDAIPALGIKVLKVPPGKGADTVVAAYKRNPNVQFAEINALGLAFAQDRRAFGLGFRQSYRRPNRGLRYRRGFCP